MLSKLYIENVAVIEKLSVDFEDGFSVLTGETGAGKSIIIDSIGLVLGMRSSRDIVRAGAGKASVSAVFTQLSGIAKELCDIGVAPDENGALLISRELTAEGKTSCRVNGVPSTAALLKAAAPYLIDIHGQRDSGALLNPEKHIEFIDSYAENEREQNAYKAVYKKVKGLRTELKTLNIDERDRERKLESLNFEIAEIEAAALKVDEEIKLSERKEVFKNLQKIKEAVDTVYSSMQGSEAASGGTPGAMELISKALGAVMPVASMSENLSVLSEQLMNLAVLSDECWDQLKAITESSEFDPDSQQQVEERLDLIYRLKKKYGADISEVLLYLERAVKERDALEFNSGRIGEIKAELKELVPGLKDAAAALTASRKNAAERLSAAVISELMELNMKNTIFSADISLLTDGEKTVYGGAGCDRAEFLISTNSGEPLKPLNKTASGGELSRIMLALKTVLSGDKYPHTLIFDEIDTGVSGSAAEKIGLKMKNIAVGRQVLCVTHLSQIAALAGRHYLIIKDSGEKGASTSVKLLEREERAVEIARINSGESFTPLAVENARQILEQAEKL